MSEKEPSFPISTPAAILLASVIISFAILIGTGIIKTGGTSGGIGVAGTQASPPPAAPTGTGPKTYQGITSGDFPLLGSDKAKVLVVEWADFQCPFCEKFFTDTESQIKKDYIDTGKVRFAFRDFAFLGQESNDAANAARCANDQGKYWQYHDYLYTHQGAENSGAFSKDNLKKFGADLGLNPGDFNSCVDSNKHAADVTKDTSAGKSVDVSGTPTVFINGTQIVGAQPYSSFKDAIDKALASAK